MLGSVVALKQIFLKPRTEMLSRLPLTAPLLVRSGRGQSEYSRRDRPANPAALVSGSPADAGLDMN